ncbi:aminoglycoside phosphotransferase family protein [Paramicrobacterium agarici]|uniref:aminoglycoside phosphotransferase family protein n=1 Tax=Paramicrobacterium agarici TaxID=630514 RepID=UPI00116A1A9D|nr:aminoglycoside phosphotransferase family protein [Microbacterium agarici]TQO21734.1 aminoglycoside phosphotransferase (APT) family kinase protein [Microbacterium agarici]
MSAIRRMHDDEVIPDAAQVATLIADQHPQWSALPVTPVASSGTDNAMFRLGDDLAVRMPRRPGMEELPAREHRWLRALAPQLPVAVPEPLALGAPGHGYPHPWLVLSWLDGENPRLGALQHPFDLARDLGAFTRAMRAIDTADGPPTGASLAERDAHVRRDIEALRDEIDADAVTAVWEQPLTLPAETAPTWVHSDVAPGNLLLRGGRLQCVIDFSWCGVGDPAIDLQVAWNLLPAEARPMLREASGVDEATWLRARARALAQALLQLPYYKTTNIPLATNARHVIAEVLHEVEISPR